MNEQDLIKQCKKQNHFAQRMLFDQYYQRMYALARRYLVSGEDVEDVLSVAFSKVFKSIETFEYRGAESLGKWIATIVINEAIRWLNKQAKMQFDELDIDKVDEDSTLEFSSDTIDVEAVFAIIESMPPGYRSVFNLFAIEGYSHKEIAGMLNVSENTSKSQLRKARNFIIQKLKKDKYGIA